jgi:hypothetical protein
MGTKQGLSRGGATYATYKLEHFKSGLFGFTGNLFYTFCTLSHPTYGDKRGLINRPATWLQ